MAHKNIDRCKETTSTTGTGTLTLTGAVSGFVAVADATIGLTSNGDTGWFCAENGSEWEVFLGTRVDATHLARTTVISSSNAGSAVSFTAAPTVFSTVPGAKAGAGGAMLSAYLNTANQSVTSGVWTKAQLNAESFDTQNRFDAGGTYRFTPNVPGYYVVFFGVNVFGAPLSTGYSAIYKNGALAAYGTYAAPLGNESVSTGSAILYLNGTTDYVELFGFGSGTTVVFKYGSGQTYLGAYLAGPA